MPLNIKITTSVPVIEKRINEALRTKLEKNIPKKLRNQLDNLLLELEEFVLDIIFRSREFVSLSQNKGLLRSDFGLDELEVSKLREIARNLFTIDIEAKSHNKYLAQFKIKISSPQPDNINYQSARNLGQYVSERSGQLIDWLEWLIFGGTDIKVDNWKVIYEDGKGRSRSAVMIRKDGEFEFSVDPEFAGTTVDNLVTRAMINNKEQIKSIFKKYF